MFGRLHFMLPLNLGMNSRFVALCACLSLCACTNSITLGAASDAGDAGDATDAGTGFDAGDADISDAPMTGDQDHPAGFTWTSEVLEGVSGSERFDYLIGSDDVGHIAVPTAFGLQYVQLKEGLAPAISSITDAAIVANNVSLALNETGAPCVAFIVSSDTSFRIACLSGTDWNVETVSEIGTGLTSLTFAIAPNGEQSVSYMQVGMIHAMIATRTPGEAWDIVQLIETSLGVSLPSIAYSSGNDLHVAALKDNGHDVLYGVRAAGERNAPALGIASASSQVTYPSIVLDAANEAHVALMTAAVGASRLRYGHVEGGVWHEQVLEPAGSFMPSFDVAAGRAGVAGIVYASRMTSEVRFASLIDDAVALGVVDNEAVPTSMRIQFDAADLPHIVYSDSVSLRVVVGARP